MASNYDTTEFVDTDFQAHKSTSPLGTNPYGSSLASRAPSTDEVTRRVTEAQQKLAELKRAQEQLERDRAQLEETRRRQAEFTNGRTEMIQHLTRGLGLLEKAEFDARREAEQMQQTLTEFRSALAQVESVREENWTQDNFNVELTRGLTAIENARMEWNSARLKFPILSAESTPTAVNEDARAAAPALLENRSLGELCKLGLALTWPLALVALLALGLMVFLVVRH
jgi:DNA repair exonuclease SbcCD ATPase subunit